MPQELPHKHITEYGLERLLRVPDDNRDNLQQRVNIRKLASISMNKSNDRIEKMYVSK